MEDDEWEFIFAEGTASPEPSKLTPRRALRGVSTLKPTSVKRKSDGKSFSPGDFILLESSDDDPYIALIHDFSFGTKGFMEVRTVWFTRPTDVLPKSKRREDALEVSRGIDVNKARANIPG